MKALDRAWLHGTPLPAAWRKRLEVCLGVVLSGAAVVALSASIRPDPEKLARHASPLVSTPPPIAELRAAPDAASAPHLTHEFLSALDAGDARMLSRTYVRGMPLEGLLGRAARTGKRSAVAWVLDHGVDIHEGEDTVDSPVLAADAEPALVAFLRERGAAEPTLDTAVRASAVQAVTRLLAAKPGIPEGRRTLLQAAAGSVRGTPADRQRITTLLLDAGCDPTAPGQDRSVLASVVATCDDERLALESCLGLVRRLVDRGAPVKGDALAVALALDESRRGLPLDALLAQPLAPGVTADALAQAPTANAGDIDRIVDKGVDWAWHDGEEDAALPVTAAIRRGDRDLVRVFLDAGAPVDPHFKDGTTPLSVALDATSEGEAYARIVELLVARGANVNRRLPDGRTPLFAAAEAGSLRVVLFLLEKGARVNERVLDDTALDVAEQHGHLPVARALDAHGAHRARPTY